MSYADLGSRDFQKILLIKLSATGDVIQTFPILNKLRQRFPHARLDWLVKPAGAELLRHNPAISNVIAFDPGLRLIARLRAAEYDLVLDLQGQLRSAVFAFASGAPVRIGFPRPRAAVWAASSRHYPDTTRRHAWQGAREGSWLAYTHHIPLPNLDVHAVDRYLGVAPLLGLDDGAADFSFPIPAEADRRVDALLALAGIASSPLVIIAPGTIWDTKQWRREGFAEVARHFLRKDFAVALIGSKSEREIAAAIATLAPGAVNLASETSLTELAALTRRAALCVTNDSGPMHLAVALGRPVVAIFGPTNPLWAGPYHRDDAVVQRDLPCSPCYLRTLRRCQHGHACMRDLAADAVIDRAERILADSDALREAADIA